MSGPAAEERRQRRGVELVTARARLAMSTAGETVARSAKPVGRTPVASSRASSAAENSLPTLERGVEMQPRFVSSKE